MAIRYPNGKVYVPKKGKTAVKKKNVSFANRGKTLEDELNETNEYYLANEMAVIHKKPVPVQVVNVRYPARSAAVITEAYFRTPSTTDYNGVFEGKYIDFEAKETKSTTSFPLQNIHEHQVHHMKQVRNAGGITFLLIYFSTLDRYFVLPYDYFEKKWERMIAGGRKSITLCEMEEISIEVTAGYNPRIDYLSALQSSLFVDDTIERQEKR